MTVKYPDLAEYYDPDLHLPISGNVYTIPSPGMDETERLAAYCFSDHSLEEHAAERAKILGPVRDQMIADGVCSPFADFAADTAIIHFAVNQDAARAVWQFAPNADELFDALQSITTLEA